MSLHHIAKHLESQGRGPDTMLVHMAPNEVQALHNIAKAHGTHLTVNPKTGLPEAGLLSMLIGGATAIFAPELLPFVAGGIGVTTALTSGSLGQGLMQGLSAWGGGQLAGNIQGLTQSGTNVAEVAKDTLQNQATAIPTVEAAQATLPQTLSGIPTDPTASFLQNNSMFQGPAAINHGAATAATSAGLPATQAGLPVSGDQLFGATKIGSVNIPSSTEMAQNLDKFSGGAKELVSHPIDSLKEIWGMPGGPMNLIGAGMNIASAFKPDPYKAPEKEDNPMHFKRISSDFKGSFPEQPRPPYQAQYRDYVANPYIPSPTLVASGGLMPNYARGDLIKYGLSLLDQKSDKAPIHAYDENAAVYGPSSNLMEYEKEYEGMSPLDRTHAKMKALFGKQSAIRPVGSLGAISYDPAIVSQQAIEAERAKTQSSKEGGLQGYALGGLSVGNLGGYSDGGRLLKGPGDGVSDSIPASIGNKQPARLAEGEFVIPARIVSELGNGSTDAGAKRLYAMMDRIKARRRKTKDIAADTKAYNLLPA